MYHGGDTLTQGRVTADAAAFVSGAQQVGGAAVMYLSLEGAEATSVAQLVTGKYLASAPVVKGSALSIPADAAAANLVTSTVTSDAVCSQINKTAGITAADTAAAADTDSALVVVAGEFASKAYGCVTADKSFQFKY